MMLFDKKETFSFINLKRKEKRNLIPLILWFTNKKINNNNIFFNIKDLYIYMYIFIYKNVCVCECMLY